MVGMQGPGLQAGADPRLHGVDHDVNPDLDRGVRHTVLQRSHSRLPPRIDCGLLERVPVIIRAHADVRTAAHVRERSAQTERPPSWASVAVHRGGHTMVNAASAQPGSEWGVLTWCILKLILTYQLVTPPSKITPHNPAFCPCSDHQPPERVLERVPNGPDPVILSAQTVRYLVYSCTRV